MILELGQLPTSATALHIQQQNHVTAYHNKFSCQRATTVASQGQRVAGHGCDASSVHINKAHRYMHVNVHAECSMLASVLIAYVRNFTYLIHTAGIV